jgi:CRISPR-associated protein Csd2
MSLENKIDFAVILKVEKANPNGDPLNGNRPRIDYSGYGEISDVALKRKLRNRLLDAGESIFVQSDDYRKDDAPSLKARFDSKFSKVKDGIPEKVCAEWFDVRSFGQVFAYSGSNKGDGISIPIRGPVTIQSAFSIEPVEVMSNQITKSVSGEGDGSKRGSDTMGMKHRIDSGIYVFKGSMNPQLAERTGFSNDDALKIKEQLPKLFENDESSARPAGSMSILKVIWWEHNSKGGQYSSAKVHQSLNVHNDGTYSLNNLEGLIPEEIDGF